MTTPSPSLRPLPTTIAAVDARLSRLSCDAVKLELAEGFEEEVELCRIEIDRLLDWRFALSGGPR